MRLVIPIVVAGLLWSGGPAAAQQASDVFTAHQAVTLARAANPMLQAARAQARAATERISIAGAWPEPSLQLGLMNRMVSGLGATDDPMTMNQLQLMQMVPWPGKLGSARRAATHAALAAEADADEQALMLVAQVRMAYYDLSYMDGALAVMRRSRELLLGLSETTRAMYAVGTGTQSDVLATEVELARMTEEITRMEQERVAGGARLNALLGRAPDTPIGSLELPPVADSLPPLEDLLARARAGRAALRAKQERVAAADAALVGARRELFPDLQVGIAYQSRPAFDDMASLMIGVTLPLFAGARQLPMRREALAMRDMAAAELTSVQVETGARVVELRARAERDARLVRLYSGTILPQARAALEASLASYRVGRTPFMTVIDQQMTINRYQLESLRLAADYQQALGELDALTGVAP